MIAPRVQYLKNRAIYGVWLKRPPTPEEIQLPVTRWDVSQLPPRAAVECPDMPGLWLIRRCVDAASCLRMMGLFRNLHDGGSFPWYRYNPGRDMMPLHGSPALDEAPAALSATALEETLPGHVFGPLGSSGADPVHGWPRLRRLLDESRDGDGARELQELQSMPQEYIQKHFGGQRCLFLQAQSLEPGAEVTAHKDPFPYGGHAIATGVVEGTSDIRVGRVQFRVDTGDIYALVDDARYEVDHEVLSASCSRTSITMRYGLRFRECELTECGEEWWKANSHCSLSDRSDVE